MLVYLLRYLNVMFRLGNYYKLSTFFLFLAASDIDLETINLML